MKDARSLVVALLVVTLTAVRATAQEGTYGSAQPIGRSIVREADRVAVEMVLSEHATAPSMQTGGSSGRHRHIGRDAKIGALAGLVVGSVGGLIAVSGHANTCADSQAGCAAAGVFIFGVIGMTYGALVGAIVGAVPTR